MARQALDGLATMLRIQINHSDDNPAVVAGAAPPRLDGRSQVASYYTAPGTCATGADGAVFPTTNFEPLPVALAVEHASLALAHVSHNAVMRTLHLSEADFTNLSRFLAAPGNQGHAFGAIQKAFVDMHIRIKRLADPVSLDGVPMAGDIEDTYSNLMLASQRLIQLVDNARYVFGLELMHAAQAIDLRSPNAPVMAGVRASPSPLPSPIRRSLANR